MENKKVQKWLEERGIELEESFSNTLKTLVKMNYQIMNEKFLQIKQDSH